LGAAKKREGQKGVGKVVCERRWLSWPRDRQGVRSIPNTNQGKHSGRDLWEAVLPTAVA